MKKILIIQSAFIGDVILATPVIEAIHKEYNDIEIDFFLRKGNEGLLNSHPLLNKTIIWDKKKNKYSNLIKLLRLIRKNKYDIVINMQRYGATGLITALSNAKIKIGFNSNPFSFAFNYRIKHSVNEGLHETERNLNLLKPLFKVKKQKPVLYPTPDNFTKVEPYKKEKYICIAPTSVWFTKQFPKNKWIDLFNQIDESIIIYLLGAPSDSELCEEILSESKHFGITNLAGKLSLLESAALMKEAKMNYVNDSAPMHIASSMNANTTAIFCSTSPSFGFGPLSDNSFIVKTEETLDCQPCGLVGKKTCPKQHFSCANSIKTSQLLQKLL